MNVNFDNARFQIAKNVLCLENRIKELDCDIDLRSVNEALNLLKRNVGLLCIMYDEKSEDVNDLSVLLDSMNYFGEDWYIMYEIFKNVRIISNINFNT